jgi:hypothetical protein
LLIHITFQFDYWFFIKILFLNSSIGFVRAKVVINYTASINSELFWSKLSWEGAFWLLLGVIGPPNGLLSMIMLL